MSLAVALMSAVCAGGAYAEDGWEANLSIAIANAESRLSFGQRPDATDGFDGKYDVPPMLGGAMSAYFSGGGNLWRDIRALDSGGKSWNVKISSTLGGSDVILKWNPKALPSDATIMLSDAVSGQNVDMKAASKYSYKNEGPREIKIEAAR